MNPEFHRCVYCEHLASLDRWTDACAEAFQAARDAGLPVAGRMVNGRALLPLDVSGEAAGRLCEAFSLLPRAELVREFSQEVADAAYTDDEEDGDGPEGHVGGKGEDGEEGGESCLYAHPAGCPALYPGNASPAGLSALAGAHGHNAAGWRP